MEIKFVCPTCDTELGRLVKENITQEDKDYYSDTLNCGTCMDGILIEDVPAQ